MPYTWIEHGIQGIRLGLIPEYPILKGSLKRSLIESYKDEAKASLIRNKDPVGPSLHSGAG